MSQALWLDSTVKEVCKILRMMRSQDQDTAILGTDLLFDLREPSYCVVQYVIDYFVNSRITRTPYGMGKEVNDSYIMSKEYRSINYNNFTKKRVKVTRSQGNYKVDLLADMFKIVDIFSENRYKEIDVFNLVSETNEFTHFLYDGNPYFSQGKTKYKIILKVKQCQ